MRRHQTVFLAALALSSCGRDQPAERQERPVAPPVLPELVRGVITGTSPCEDCPELPALPAGLVSNVAKESGSSPPIRRAYAKLDASKQRHTAWAEGLAELEKEKAIWCLQSALCHPNLGVRIRVLDALARLRDERSLPFLLSYGSAMAVGVDGSEVATLQAGIRVETAKALSAVTGIQFKMANGVDPDGLKMAVAACRSWISRGRKGPDGPPLDIGSRLRRAGAEGRDPNKRPAGNAGQ